MFKGQKDKNEYIPTEATRLQSLYFAYLNELYIANEPRTMNAPLLAKIHSLQSLWCCFALNFSSSETVALWDVVKIEDIMEVRDIFFL